MWRYDPKPTHTRFYDLVALQVEDVRHEVSIALHPIQNSIVLASSNGSASLAVPGWLIDVAEGTAPRVVRRETPRASKFKLHEGRSQGSKSLKAPCNGFKDVCSCTVSSLVAVAARNQ